MKKFKIVYLEPKVMYVDADNELEAHIKAPIFAEDVRVEEINDIETVQIGGLPNETA